MWQESGAPWGIREGTCEFGLTHQCGCHYKGRKMQKFRPCAVCMFLVTCFCDLDVLIVVEFISDVLTLLQKKNLYFPSPQVL